MLVFSCFLLLGFVHADDDHNEAFELLNSGDVLSLEKILQLNKNNIHGKILDIELEHEDNKLIYELNILDNKGIVWEIKVDAKDGTIIKKELDD